MEGLVASDCYIRVLITSDGEIVSIAYCRVAAINVDKVGMMQLKERSTAEVAARAFGGSKEGSSMLLSHK